MASSKKNYDVFLSFRGPDVRNNFLSHLYAALDWNGIHTFLDNEELRKGEEISPTLVRAIEESRIAIIIFSEDYASSRWCLEELVKIMECKTQKGLIVLPVFYKVEPREVKRAYKRTMTKHETKFGKDSKIVDGWKKALLEAGNLSGWHIYNENEAEIIQDIVEKVLSDLERATHLDVAEHQVVIDSRVQEVILRLQKESDDDDVLMIGLWGPEGIGKTTIAEVIYEAIKRQFQGCSFLPRVKETSTKGNGLVDLQRELLSHILSPRQPTVYTKVGGMDLIKKKLHDMKVLLVLDDVDQSDQLEALAGASNWFGKGSRIFVTTRNRLLLTSSHCKSRVYEVRPLKHDEALKLFHRRAFPNSEKVEMRKDLIDRALNYASGFPLALNVLGSFLCGRNESEWESALHDISKYPNETINGILKTSFEGLGYNEREIFLDIACFFKGKGIKDIEEVLDGCDFKTLIGVKTLIEKSLIRDEHGTLQMHDLVQLMGKNIVKQKYPNNPGKRSRLWLFEDFQDILLGDTGTGAVEAIVLDLPTPEERTMSVEEITIKADAFRNMAMMRMLILPEVRISSEGPICLPFNLRWLKWPNAPLLEFGHKLIEIDVPKSHIKDLEGKTKPFKMLKYVNFSQCNSLVSVPDFSSAPILESLCLDGCKSLVEVHQSVAYHSNLKFLSLLFCSNLTVFPNTLKAKSLRALDLFGCSKLKKFSYIPEKMEQLEELDLGLTAIKELPPSIENLLSVNIINLTKCKRLTTLPSSIYKLQNLEHLNLIGCSNFVTFPKNSEDSNNPNGNPGFRKLKWLELNGCNLSEVEFLENSSSFPKLRHLDLSRNKFTHLPTCINKYKYLEHLYVDKCKQIQKIPQLPRNVHSFSARCCRSLQEFPDLSSLSSDCCSVQMSSCRKLFRKGANMAHALSLEGLPKMRNVNILLIGSEMPKWFFHVKDSSISFTVPGDLYDKFLGLALCFVLHPKGGKAVRGRVLVGIDVNGHNLTGFQEGVDSMECDHVWMGYIPSRKLTVGRKRMPDDYCHFLVDFSPETEVELKECGFRPICEQQEDDLRIVQQPHQPMKTNWLSQMGPDDWIYPKEEESSSETDDEESSSETDDELIEAIDQEKEKPGLFKADKIGPSEERDSEEDNSMDTEEEESSSEADDELIKPIDEEKEKRVLLNADKIHDHIGTLECIAAEDLCRSLKTWTRERFLRGKYGRTCYGSGS